MPPTLLEALHAAVRLATGSASSQPRGGQAALAEDIEAAMAERGSSASEAPTGSGKSLAYLVPAMLAATQGERTVVSTQSLSLQSQLANKDAPVVADAVADLVGRRPKFAVLRGWSNYVCALAAMNEASRMFGVDAPSPESMLGALDGPTTVLDGNPELVEWAIRQVVDEDDAERSTFGGDVTDAEWRTVSTTPSECPGVDHCRLGEVCPAARSRQLAADADVVITNHALLAVQAAKGVPVVIGSKRLGPIDHLVVDEAHALASAVRSQGSGEVSGRRLLSCVRAFEGTVVESQANADALRVIRSVAERIDQQLLDLLGAKPVATIEAGDPEVEDIVSEVKAALKTLRSRVPKIESAAFGPADLKLMRLFGRISSYEDDLSVMASDAAGVARWIEREEWRGASSAIARLSLVDVSGRLRGNLYEPGSDDAEPLSVTLVSATLPQAAVVDLGVSARVTVHPSPFEDAYERSALYVPKDADGQLLRQTGGRRSALDVERHVAWAERHIVRLVEANGGSALILAATAAAGRRYAETLHRASGDWDVLSQWDDRPVAATIGRWRSQTRSVLVGTRGLMTGVDAPGATCSLVVVDRVPRSAGNPVDDARVALLAERMSLSRWDADRLVYVADAATLLEQAAGRLIRSASDHGVLAVLDPRLLKTYAAAYPEQTRRQYLAALGAFPHRYSNWGDVAELLGATGAEPSAVPA